MKPRVHFRDFGKADYRPVWDEQERVFAEMLARKSARRSDPSLAPPDSHLFFVEHAHVFTLECARAAG